ncbi:MAG: hypothetical protein ACK4IX_07240 [Candidatus Sericytochromatia bacterium]
MKKIYLITFISSLILTTSTYASNGVLTNVEPIFTPLPDNGSQPSFFYGLKGYSELHEYFRINYGINTLFSSGYIVNVPLSISFVPSGSYKFNLRPQVFLGGDLFYSTLNSGNFKGLKFYGHAGLGLDYIFDNSLIVNVGTKIYFNDSFLQTTINKGFNSGTLSFFGGIGFKY